MTRFAPLALALSLVLLSACSGKDKAPRIGDAKAWAGRASQGLTALTDHAIKGIRIEYEGAVADMNSRSPLQNAEKIVDPDHRWN